MAGTSAVGDLPYQRREYLPESAAALDTLDAGKRVMVVVPMRALFSEIAAEWTAVPPDMSVQAYTGDTPGTGTYRENRVQVLTPERLDLIHLLADDFAAAARAGAHHHLQHPRWVCLLSRRGAFRRHQTCPSVL